ncbi:MAG TPA: hypothetical protein VK184_17375 [Nostocaceae cyanobacterium]|nr:hypothetical protein [Nostocaceae cyanobacterium]
MFARESDLIGKTEVEANEYARTNGYKLFVTMRDGITAGLVITTSGEKVIKLQIKEGIVSQIDFMSIEF